MKIGILGKGFISWGGGLDFLRLIINGINSKKNDRDFELVILLPVDGVKNRILKVIKLLIKYLIGKNIGKKNKISHKEIHDYLSNIIGDFKIIEYKDDRKNLYKTIKRLGIEILLPSVDSLGSDFPVKWVGYIPDFQHKYLKEYFTDRDVRKRDQQYSDISKDASKILVNSTNAKKDLINFLNCSPNKVQELPFSPSVVDVWLEDYNSSLLLKKYNISSNFFIISNQFWIHKDHKTAFRAFKIFCEKINSKSEISLVCTGKTNDTRFPNYFNELLSVLKEYKLEKNVKILGLIPKIDQINLLKESIALIQPTLFEGGPGGGSAYDAVALGKRVIVSDIEINKEIIGEKITFFKAGNDNDLAEKMFKVYQENEKFLLSKSKIIEESNRNMNRLGNIIFSCLDSL